MLPRQTFRIRITLPVGLLVGVLSCAVNVWAQGVSPRPYSKEAIVGLLKGEVSPKRIAVLARERGIDFQITRKVESELRQVGATPALLATLREIAPKPPAPQIETPRRVVSAPAARTVRENPKDGLKYVWIPPGTFIMGCSPGDKQCNDEEKPPHQVTITRGFWIGQTPVTVGAYKRFTAASGLSIPPEPELMGRALNPGWGNEAMPIVGVAWIEADAYCTWEGGRLPTEAEWEYAARGGSTEARYGYIDDVAWYAVNSGFQRLDSPQITFTDVKTYVQALRDNGNGMHEVGLKRPNAFGLYDMLGNVEEWVNDWYDQNYYQNSPSQDPTGPASGQDRILRGGSFLFPEAAARASYRLGTKPTKVNEDFGFRCGGEVFAP